MNITHEHPEYRELRFKCGKGRFNGAYYYAKEIEKNIIPRVKTKREWNTVGRDLEGMHDGMIVFLHDNSTPWHYQWLRNYNDLILVCSSQYTADSVKYSGKTILLPMSIDTKYVKRFRTEKTREICFVGNVWVRNNARKKITGNVDFFSALPREELLEELAKYKAAYCIDRCKLEALTLNCKVLPLDVRYGCDDVDKVLDNRDAAKILQKELNKIDKGGSLWHRNTGS